VNLIQATADETLETLFGLIVAMRTIVLVIMSYLHEYLIPGGCHRIAPSLFGLPVVATRFKQQSSHTAIGWITTNVIAN
jgi:hypothetical protein